MKHDFLLPPPAYQQPRIKIRTILGHCLYRRVIIWTATILLLLGIMLYSGGGVHATTDRVLDFVDFGKKEYWGGVIAVKKQIKASGTLLSQDNARVPAKTESEPPHWLRYRHLDGYFNGLRALVSPSSYTPEYPRRDGDVSRLPLAEDYADLPTPTPFGSQPDYNSPAYRENHYPVRTCYLDANDQIPAPSLYAYNGIVQGQPEPVIGSHSLLGIRDDICWDRFGRYGPYGLGYGEEEGGIYEGTDIEKEGNEAVWSQSGRINYNSIDWAEVQARCHEKNKARFSPPDEDQSLSTLSSAFTRNRDQDSAAHQSIHANTQPPHLRTLDRVAVVIRTYVGFQWTQHAVLNFRAMINELSLRSAGEYTVHFLLHVHDDDYPIWADAEVAQQVLDDNVPAEFHGLCTLWSEAQMRLLYPGDFGEAVENPSGQDVHGVYRSAHMPLQHFALTHPEYAHFWNWEMDMRWVGDYYELFDRLGKWAAVQSRRELWERNERYYIPAGHGSWENFTALMHRETEGSGRRAVKGPVNFAGRQSVRSEEQARLFLPASCAAGSSDPALCGVGEEADLITLNPIFDAEDSGWVFASDVTGYETYFDTPPRRVSIITASRLSRRLLAVMHEETWRMRHAMFSEMFPATMALHHGLKAVYAPHPVYLDREWDHDVLDRSFNSGRDHSTSGKGSPYDYDNEHNHKGTSWYFNSEFAGLLWRRWLGYAQMDGRGPGGGRGGHGTLRGGKKEEERPGGTGRMCLRSMLVHPVKWEHPAELSLS
ncbi:hypothetical protein GE09DRAFT_976415 [Coniochaeta sp. 2T2.1]|nr:hypothetical protein GE09DRAFT_976415 [Coniochaeta sp. 2T2.1]